MKKSCLYFDKKYKCVSYIVHYKGLNFNAEDHNCRSKRGISVTEYT